MATIHSCGSFRPSPWPRTGTARWNVSAVEAPPCRFRNSASARISSDDPALTSTAPQAHMRIGRRVKMGGACSSAVIYINMVI